MLTTPAHAATECCTLRRGNAVNDEHQGWYGPVEIRNSLLLPLSVSYGQPVKNWHFLKLAEKGDRGKCSLFLWMTKPNMNDFYQIIRKQTGRDCVVRASVCFCFFCSGKLQNTPCTLKLLSLYPENFGCVMLKWRFVHILHVLCITGLHNFWINHSGSKLHIER